MPEFKVSRTIQEDGSCKLMLQFPAETRDGGHIKSLTRWNARSSSLDFRESEWTPELPSPIEPTTERSSFIIQAPDSGHLATFVDLTCDVDGVPYHLSTLIGILSAPKK